MNQPTEAITVNISKDRIASCQGCGKANYDGSFNVKKEVDTLLDIAINTAGRSNMTTIIKMCPDCLQDLSQKIHPYRTGIVTKQRTLIEIRFDLVANAKQFDRPQAKSSDSFYARISDRNIELLKEYNDLARQQGQPLYHELKEGK